MDLKAGLDAMLSIEGAMCASIVDYSSGMMLASAGGGLDLEVASAGNTQVIRAKMKTMKDLGISEEIEDMLITLDSQYHLIRPMHSKKGIFVYFVLNRAQGNLAMARIKLKDVESKLTF